MKIHQLSIDQALASVQSSPRGLSSLEAERRLREHGLNVVQELPREPAWLRLLREFFQFSSSRETTFRPIAGWSRRSTCVPTIPRLPVNRYRSDDNFASIVNAIEEGRAVYENIRKFLTYVLVHNVAELVPYLAFVLLKVPLTLTPIQTLAIDMGTDSLTALGLGVERPAPRVMQRPPRRRDERLMNWPLALRAYLFLGPIEAVAAMAAFFCVLYGAGWSYGQDLSTQDPLYLQATTACLAAIIVMQIANVFLCRSASRSLLATGLSGNPLIASGVALELALVLLIAYTPWGNAIFGTAPVAGRVWVFVLPFAAGMIVLEELRKRLVRTSAGPTSP